MIGQNFNGLPNGRMVIACLSCGNKHDVRKFGWTAIVCQLCNKRIDHPIAGIKSSKQKCVKTNLMLNKNSRDLIYTISKIEDCSQSEALNMLLKFSFDEYRASNGPVMSNAKDASIWTDKPSRKKVTK